MVALLQASTALSAKWTGTRNSNASSFKTPQLLVGSVCGFTGTSLCKPWQTRVVTRRPTSGRPGVARAGDTMIEKTCQVGDHFLDNVSNFILRQIQKPFAKYIPVDWDPFDFLPVNIQSNLQKSEALATLVLRETFVLAAFYLVYHKVDAFCRFLYGVYTRKQRNGKEVDDAAYNASPFRAAQVPVRSLVMIWASTRVLWVTSLIWKLQAVITSELVYDIRASSLVCTITWFLFRWKRVYVEELINQRPLDESRIFAVDKLVSLAMYGLAASCVTEVLGLKLRSLLAVGGVSGLAVGLAAQQVVGNMFGGASLFISRPFVVGEKIKAGSVSGRVEDIGFMQTKVQGFDGVPVLVPNQAFTSQVITNFSRAKVKVLEAKFQLDNRHIFFVHNITEEVQKYLSSHSSVETVKATPICYLKSMQNDGQNGGQNDGQNDGPVIALSCVIKATGSAVFYKVQQEILIRVAEIITDILGPDSPFRPLKNPSSGMEIVNNQGLVL